MSIELKDLPDVSFVETDINKILSDMIAGYEAAYFEQTGEVKKLYPGDPIRIFLYSQALRELQLRVSMNEAAKQNLLKYANGENLENLGAFFKTEILEATAAYTTQRFNLSAARPTDEVIPIGTRVSPGNEIYFSVLEPVTIPAGTTSIDAKVYCTDKGTIGNGFTPGQINILVDPLPFNANVENIDTSHGGTDLESDDNYRNRIHLAPEGFSVAGPEGAYEYFARQYSSLISDLKITSPSDGVVDIRILLKNGVLPDTTFINGVFEYLNAKERRPLTDKLQTSAPTTTTYDLNVTYYLRSSDIAIESELKTKVEAAIDEYVTWQRSKIGRDVNPSELISKMIVAGAKRVVVTSPIHTAISDTQIAVLGTKSATYGGMESD